jgi:hypothetical protein
VPQRSQKRLPCWFAAPQAAQTTWSGRNQRPVPPAPPDPGPPALLIVILSSRAGLAAVAVSDSGDHDLPGSVIPVA